MKFTAFGGCRDWAAVAESVSGTGLDAAIYIDANDPV
jgi:hypothetical protein